jgi:AcrR family transcriptional regulator
MPTTKADNRAKLVQATMRLSYRHGFGKASLADIAREARVPVGNVYYYFKSKDAIGEAIVEERLSQLQAKLKQWDEAGSAEERLCAFIEGVLANHRDVARSGCAIGTLCTELHKSGGGVATKATALLAQCLNWSETQFRAMGEKAEAPGLAVHLLSALQGVAVLAHSFRNPDLIAKETARLKEWIRSLQDPIGAAYRRRASVR